MHLRFPLIDYDCFMQMLIWLLSCIVLLYIYVIHQSIITNCWNVYILRLTSYLLWNFCKSILCTSQICRGWVLWFINFAVCGLQSLLYLMASCIKPKNKKHFSHWDFFFHQQISKALAGADRKDLMRKLPKFIYDEDKALEVRKLPCCFSVF